MRKTAMLWLVLAVICGGMLFQTSQRVTDGRAQLAGIDAAARKEDEHLRVLQAEWSYLNQPDRLEKLSKQYLRLAPLKGKQFTKVVELEERPAAPVTEAPAVAPETSAAVVVVEPEVTAPAAEIATAPIAAAPVVPAVKPPAVAVTPLIKPQPFVKAKPQPSLVWKAPPPPAARKPGIAWSAPQLRRNLPTYTPSAPQQQQPRKFGDLMKSLGVQ